MTLLWIPGAVDSAACDSAAYDYDYSSDNSYDEYGGDDYDYAPADSVAAY